MTFDATFPTVFYEKLENAGWELDNINTNDVLRYTANPFTGLGWEITADQAGIFYAELVTYEVSGNFLFKIIYEDSEITLILDTLIEFQKLDWENITKSMLQKIFTRFSSIPKCKAYFCKYTTSKESPKTTITHELEMNASNIQKMLQPQFEVVSGFSFYLAGVLESQIVVLQKNIDAAWAKLQKSEEIAQKHENLDEFIKEMTFEKPVYNDTGDIINFVQGGDMWIYPELEHIAEFIESGSYFVIQDDGYQLHKAEYQNGKVMYSSEII